MTEDMTAWDEMRRIADELELKLHLASMDARDRWRAMQPRLAELEKQIAVSADRAHDAILKELNAWRQLRHDMAGE